MKKISARAIIDGEITSLGEQKVIPNNRDKIRSNLREDEAHCSAARAQTVMNSAWKLSKTYSNRDPVNNS